jgi:hypothetical protein
MLLGLGTGHPKTCLVIGHHLKYDATLGITLMFPKHQRTGSRKSQVGGDSFNYPTGAQF